MIDFDSRIFGVFLKRVLLGTAGTKNDMAREISHVAFGNLVNDWNFQFPKQRNEG